jgi:phenylpyruvate tautomerase PptA (4-oxalocrotonate tautomerase family)
VCNLPLIEITVARDTLNEEERLRLAEAVQKTMIKEFEEMKGRTPGSYVIVHAVANETWLVTKSSS